MAARAAAQLLEKQINEKKSKFTFDKEYENSQ
jgi:hypothetical protein